MAQDPRPPSPSAFFDEEPLFDSIYTPSDTASGFAELLDDLDTTILPHGDEKV
jgi:hypothetical protein